MKRGFLIFWLGLCCALCLLLHVPDTAAVYLFPGLTLQKAGERAAAQLWDAYENSPINPIAVLLEQPGAYCISLDLQWKHHRAGETQVKIDGGFQNKPRRIRGKATFLHSGYELDALLYLDQNTAAVSSSRLLQNRWYGFAYDRLCQNIRENSTLHTIIGDANLQKLDQSLERVKNQVNREVPAIWTVRWQDIDQLGMGLMLLPWKVSHHCEELGGKREILYTVSCEVTAEQIREGLNSAHVPAWAEYIRKWLQDHSDAVIKVGFDLLDGEIYTASVLGEIADAEFNLKVHWRDMYSAELRLTDHKLGVQRCISFLPNRDSSEYNRSILVTREKEKTLTETRVDYRWDAETGNLWLSYARGDVSGTLHALVKQDMLRLETANLDRLIQIITGKSHGFAHCVCTIEPGEEISGQEYMDITRCTVEDLYILLAGVGDVVLQHSE